MRYRPRLTDYARHQLTTLSSLVVDTLLDCINELSDDPLRDPQHRVTLVIPLYRIFPDAYVCGDWAIAYQVEDPDELLIEAFGQLFYRP